MPPGLRRPVSVVLREKVWLRVSVSMRVSTSKPRVVKNRLVIQDSFIATEIQTSISLPSRGLA